MVRLARRFGDRKARHSHPLAWKGFGLFWLPRQNMNLSPNCTSRGWLSCELTTPNCGVPTVIPG